jgi:capsular exopolysaccharide synthesis family protein
VRVDTGSPAAPSSDDLDARAQLKRYLQALRRKWYLLVVFTVVGAGLGWVSAPSSSSTEILNRTRYYEAVHTIIRSNAGASQGGTTVAYQPTLPQAAYLVGTGDVPTEVARQLDLEVGDVEGSVVGIPRNEVSSIEVKAIGTDRERVVTLADTSAEVLITQLDQQAQVDFETARNEVVSRLDRLDGEVNAINLQLINDPDSPQLIAQQRSLAQQYSLAYEQFTQLANQPLPSANLSSLQPAKAEEISESDFEKVKDDIAAGLPYVTGVAVSVPEGGRGGTGAPGQGAPAPTRAALGGMVGLGLAVGLVLALDRFDNRLRHRADVEAATGLPVLAEIPPLSRHQQHALEVVAHTQHRSRSAEAYRVVRSALLFAVETDEVPRPEGQALVVMITSANPEEGKTTTVANMAAVLAEGGFRVLVINCDFRRPRVHKYLVAETDQRQDQPSAADPANATRVAVSTTAIDRVKLITGVGEHDPDANPLDVVAMQRKVIQMARGRYDVILLDTAPFLTTNDASELLSETDEVLVVVRAGKTRRLAARRTAEILERFEAPVLGVIMNDSDETPAAQYYYTYYLDGSGKKKRTDGYVSRSSGDGADPAAGVTPNDNGSLPAAAPGSSAAAGAPPSH